ncbi:hypothetical protein [Flavobacterium sp.]|uniref:hypothetical protein n=1 Tax=Flavobacterium sp. TaxID=239 RepID=UPI004047CB50
MKLTIRNYDTDLKSEKFDIIIPCKSLSNVKTSYVNFEFEEKQRMTAKFLLDKDVKELTEFNFCFFKNTNLIFFRFIYQWGIIDLKNKKMKRNITDMSLDFPFFYLHENCILIIDDLFAETVTLEGDSIDKIRNEQPHEVKEFDDYFEFDIIGIEKRKLMKKGYN